MRRLFAGPIPNISDHPQQPPGGSRFHFLRSCRWAEILSHGRPIAADNIPLPYRPVPIRDISRRFSSRRFAAFRTGTDIVARRMDSISMPILCIRIRPARRPRMSSPASQQSAYGSQRVQSGQVLSTGGGSQDWFDRERRSKRSGRPKLSEPSEVPSAGDVGCSLKFPLADVKRFDFQSVAFRTQPPRNPVSLVYSSRVAKHPSFILRRTP